MSTWVIEDVDDDSIVGQITDPENVMVLTIAGLVGGAGVVPVTSVNGEIGDVVLDHTHVGADEAGAAAALVAAEADERLAADGVLDAAIDAEAAARAQGDLDTAQAAADALAAEQMARGDADTALATAIDGKADAGIEDTLTAAIELKLDEVDARVLPAPTAGTPGQMPAVTAGGDAYELVDPPEGGGGTGNAAMVNEGGAAALIIISPTEPAEPGVGDYWFASLDDFMDAVLADTAGGVTTFAALTDVDWSTPPTEGQVFAWDATASKLVPVPPPADGIDGDDGVGVPVGGADGQVLAKASAADHDTEWIDPPTGGTAGVQSTTGVTHVEQMTQAEYDALDPKSPTTLYIVPQEP